MPTYNREKEVARALDSILGQTFQDFEILVCDDASTDSTREVVRSYQQRDRRIKLLCLTENQGAGASRNLGLREACGQFIAFLDSDDEWLADKLARQVSHMEAQPARVGVCFCGAEIIRDGGTRPPASYTPQLSWEQDTYRKYVLDQMSFITPTILFRRSCLDATGLMVPQMRRNQDMEFLLRLLRHFGLAVIPDCLVRVHLVTAPSKRTYDRMKQAAVFREAHITHIRQECGKWAATRYGARIKMELCDAALRERRWGAGLWELGRRLGVLPVLFPSEYVRLVKAVIRAFTG